jgi:putative flavoprotein involved in K+ transport
MSQKTGTVIIGGGQAGLATSYYLNQRGREHIILERAAQAGNAWRNDRWDSFILLTPNWSLRLPGAEYQGNAPDGFMSRDEIVACFEEYVDRFHLPVHYQVRATSVEPNTEGEGYLVRTEESMVQARNVVIATGLFQRPKMPSISADLSTQITQLRLAIRYFCLEQVVPDNRTGRLRQNQLAYRIIHACPSWCGRRSLNTHFSSS